MYCIFTTTHQQLRTAHCCYYKHKPIVVSVLSPPLLWPACGSGAPCFSEAPVLMLVPQLISLCIGTRYGSDSARYLTVCQTKWLFQLARAGCGTEKPPLHPTTSHVKAFQSRGLADFRVNIGSPLGRLPAQQGSAMQRIS